jgi:hypothetical protein
VVFAGLEEDAVAGSDDLDGAAAALGESDALGDIVVWPFGWGGCATPSARSA